jgi:hypothetical protein
MVAKLLVAEFAGLVVEERFTGSAGACVSKV